MSRRVWMCCQIDAPCFGGCDAGEWIYVADDVAPAPLPPPCACPPPCLAGHATAPWQPVAAGADATTTTQEPHTP